MTFGILVPPALKVALARAAGLSRCVCSPRCCCSAYPPVQPRPLGLPPTWARKSNAVELAQQHLDKLQVGWLVGWLVGAQLCCCIQVPASTCCHADQPTYLLSARRKAALTWPPPAPGAASSSSSRPTPSGRPSTAHARPGAPAELPPFDRASPAVSPCHQYPRCLRPPIPLPRRPAWHLACGAALRLGRAATWAGMRRLTMMP